MTPKEKAGELVDKFYQTTPNEYFVNEPIGIKGRYKSWEQAKQCALIAVDEIIPIVNSYENALSASQQSNYLDYWYAVKEEIKELKNQ